MAKKIYPSLNAEDSSQMLCAYVEWKDGKINIGKEFGMDGIKVTNFHLRFGLKL